MEIQDISKDMESLLDSDLSREDLARIIAARQEIVSHIKLDFRVSAALEYLRQRPGLEGTKVAFYLITGDHRHSEIRKMAVSPLISDNEFPGTLNEVKILEEDSILPTNGFGFVVVRNHGPIEKDAEKFLDTYVKLNLKTTIKNALAYEINLEAATTDDLTRAYRRNFFRNQFGRDFEREVVRNGGSGLSLFMMDIDYFKKYNDELGHLEGDNLLRRFAGILQKNIRPFDILGRWGGEEFVISLPGLSLEDAKAKGEDLLQKIKDVQFKGEAIMPNGDITFTMGVAHAPTHDTSDPLYLLGCADLALLYGKEHGRSQVVIYNPDIHGQPDEETLELFKSF